MKIAAYDLGTLTGVAYINTLDKNPRYISAVWDLKTKAKTKKQLAEPKRNRLLKFYEKLMLQGKPDIICFEDNSRITRNINAVIVHLTLRGILELYACLGNIKVYPITSQELQRYALGSCALRGDEKKQAMIKFAQDKYGYDGISDDEAEAIICLHWGIEYYGS